MALRADDVDLGRDRDLVARYQAGDPEAFGDLYRHYFGRLHRYCQRHTRDSHEAEEVAQEAFVRALRAMHTLEGERRFYPWMTVIAKRITIDRHRRDRWIDLTDEPDLGSIDPDIEHLFDAVDAGHVRQAMEGLGPRHREVLDLRETQGMSYGQIAEHLAVPVTTVEALLHRARKALRREFVSITGESRGLLGLPVLGWLATKVADLRARAGDRWVEIGAVAAPLAVGAVTTAVMLVPSPGSAPAASTVSAGRASAPVVHVVDGPISDDAGEAVVVGSSSTEDRATPEPRDDRAPAPGVSTGSVDVFTDPEGAGHAGDEAGRLPTNTGAGPVRAGVDVTRLADHANAHAHQILSDTIDDHHGETP